MSKLFSIIVPVYNVEKFLPKCIDSLLRQNTDSEYEILIVDDGSTDSCGEICDSYMNNHHNVKAFHKQNGGLSDARNYGVLRASGEYLLFIDSDDYISDNALENARIAIDRAKDDGVFLDVVIAEGQFFDKNGHVDSEKWFNKNVVNGDRGYTTGKKMLEYTLSHRCNWAAWGKFYRREYWDQKHFFFMKGRLSEDMQLIDRVILEAKYVSMVPAFVYYRYRDGSIINTVKLVNILSIIDNLADWEKYFRDNDIPAKIKNGISYNLGYSFYQSALSQVYNLDGLEVEKALELVKSKLDWINYVNGIEGISVKIAISVLGISNTCKLLALKKRMFKQLKNFV